MRDQRPKGQLAYQKGASAAAAITLLIAGFTPTALAQAPQKVLRISVAADLAPAMPAIAQNYERQSGVKILVTSGSSEKQVARIEAGDPIDLFLGGDFTYPEKLVADGLTDAKAPVAYAKNTLVLFARKDSPLQPISLETLQNEKLQSIAVPRLLQTPLGRASAAAFTKLKVMDRLKPKLIETEDDSSAADLVDSGKAQIAALPLTLARSDHYRSIGSFIIIPESQYPELREYAVILKKGEVSAAHQFLSWLLSSEVQSKLPNVGLEAVR